MDFPPPPEQIVQTADNSACDRAQRGQAGTAKRSRGRRRRALLEILKRRENTRRRRPKFIIGLAGILVEQGRYQEAEKLARSARRCAAHDRHRRRRARDRARILSRLGNILILQRKTKQAAGVYAQLERPSRNGRRQQREAFELNGSRIAALYATGQIDAGIAAAEALVKRQTARTGAKSYDTASAHGMLAVGYARAGRDADAVREFKAALPILMAATSETDEDDPTLVAARNARLQRIVEAYIGVLARGTTMSNDVAVETFGLADAVRGHAVEQALADSSARMVAKDPALAELVRTDQDHAKQIDAQLGALNNMLALPSDQRDDNTVRAMNAEIDKLRAERKAAQQEIKRRFPAYADLVDPKPPTVDEIKAALRPGEALLSFYFGQDASYRLGGAEGRRRGLRGGGCDRDRA